MTRILWILLLLGSAGCSLGRDEPSLDNPFDPGNAEGFPVPGAVTVTVGSDRVRLDWEIEDPGTYDTFAVFRTRLDVEPAEEEELLAIVSTRFYEDTRIRSGRSYEYRVAAGHGGRFGERSEPVEANPGLFAILIADDAPKTRLRDVSVTVQGPGPVEAIQLSDRPDFTDVPWRRPATTLPWVLEPGDGEKTVYARFRMVDGSISFQVMDRITLDTRAWIQSVSFDGPAVQAPGDIIHFYVDAGEPGGAASVVISGLFTAVVLGDDGTNGDTTADDGIYERTIAIPPGKTVIGAAVTATFNDDIGNGSGPVDADRTLTVQEPPLPVTLLDPELAIPPDVPLVTLRWTQSQEAAFQSYRLFRSDVPTPDARQHLVGSVTGRTTLELGDRDITEGAVYYYQVFIRATTTLETGSNVLQVTVPNLRPPVAVTLDDPEAVAADRVALSWSANEDPDFAAYRVFRNPTGAVTDADLEIRTIPDRSLLFLDDLGLQENTVYYYRVYTEDLGGLTTRSNEVSARTRNLPPVAVVLAPAADVSGAGLTLSWSASDAHDFASYRIYRDTIPTVSSASTLVVEIDDVTVLSFRDTERDPSTTTYYRVYVVDDGVDPGPASTGSNTITVNGTLSSVMGELHDDR